MKQIKVDSLLKDKKTFIISTEEALNGVEPFLPFEYRLALMAKQEAIIQECTDRILEEVNSGTIDRNHIEWEISFAAREVFKLYSSSGKLSKEDE